MSEDPRDKLWDATFVTYYDSYFEEMCAGALIHRWLTVDTISRFLVAATTSGSAIAGWALWSGDVGRYVWAIIAGIAALLSIASASLRVESLLQQYNEVVQTFTALRVRLETFRQQLDLDPDFSVEDMTAQYLQFREDYAKALQTKPNDLINTNRFATSIQDKLNARLGDQIEAE
jgi:hypothetical protein